MFTSLVHFLTIPAANREAAFLLNSFVVTKPSPKYTRYIHGPQTNCETLMPLHSSKVIMEPQEIKVLQEIHIGNLKFISLSIQKLWPRFKVSISKVGQTPRS